MLVSFYKIWMKRRDALDYFGLNIIHELPKENTQKIEGTYVKLFYH